MIDVLLDLDGSDVCDVHLAEVWNQVVFQRFHVCAVVGVALDKGFLIHFQAGVGPCLKPDIMNIAVPVYAHLNLILHSVLLGLFLGIGLALGAVKGLAKQGAVDSLA